MGVNNGDFRRVENALRAGANANARDAEGYSALHVAAELNRVEIAALLIESGADIEARKGAAWLGVGYTPLAWAARSGSRGVAVVLLDAGADAKRSSPCGLPQECARSADNDDLARLIEAHGIQ